MENLDSAAWIAAALTPSAVAPHPNFSQDEPSYPGLLALVVQFRDDEIDRYQEALSPSAPEWAGNLVEAARASVQFGQVRSGANRLWDIASSQDIPLSARIVAALFASVAEVELDEHPVAIQKLEVLADDWEDGPVSASVALGLACIRHQIAARHFEMFRYDLAESSLRKEEALLTQEGDWTEFRVSMGVSWDSTQVLTDIRSALIAHCTELKSRIEGFGGSSWVDVVRSRATWPDYRGELSSAGRDRKFVEAIFEQSIGFRSLRRTYARRDPIVSPALESLLTAELAGDVNAFMQRREALAQVRVLQIARESSAASEWETQDAIRLLRRARARRSLKKILEWIYLQGPSAAVVSDAMLILGRTGFPGDVTAYDLMVLSSAATFLESDARRAASDSALRFLATPNGAEGSRLEDERTAWSALGDLIEGTGLDDVIAKRALERASSDDSSELVERELTRVFDRIDWDRVDSRTVERWRDWGAKEETLPRSTKALALQARSVQLDVDHRETLSRLSGIEYVIHLINHKEELPSVPRPAIQKAVDILSASLRGIQAEAAHGSFSIGGYDSTEVAAIFAYKFSEEDTWQDVSEILINSDVPRDMKERALNRVADFGRQDVPSFVQAALKAHWGNVVNSQNVDTLFSGSALGAKFSEALRAGTALGILSRNESIAAGTELAGSQSIDDRVAATTLLVDVATAHNEWEWAQTVLLHLIADQDPTVRSEAARSLASMKAAQTGLTPLVRVALSKALAADGVRTPLLTLHGLQRVSVSGNWRELGDDIVHKVESLANDHRAQVVRRAARHLLEGPS